MKQDVDVPPKYVGANRQNANRNEATRRHPDYMTAQRHYTTSDNGVNVGLNKDPCLCSPSGSPGWLRKAP